MYPILSAYFGTPIFLNLEEIHPMNVFELEEWEKQNKVFLLIFFCLVNMMWAWKSPLRCPL